MLIHPNQDQTTRPTCNSYMLMLSMNSCNSIAFNKRIDIKRKGLSLKRFTRRF